MSYWGKSRCSALLSSVGGGGLDCNGGGASKTPKCPAAVVRAACRGSAPSTVSTASKNGPVFFTNILDAEAIALICLNSQESSDELMSPLARRLQL